MVREADRRTAGERRGRAPVKDAPLRHRVEWVALRPLLATVERLPLTQARALGTVLGALACRLDHQRRAVALENLRFALPELTSAERHRIASASFRNLGASLMDALAASRLDAARLCQVWRIDGFEHVLAGERERRGVLLMTAHLGCWEVVSWLMGASGRPLVAVGRPPDNPHLDARLRRLRERFGNTMVNKRGAARGLMRRLRAGGYAGILIDQRVRPGQGSELPFFDRPALTSLLPAQLSLRTGAPVVPAFGFLEAGGRYRAELHEPIWPDISGAGAEEALTRRYLSVMEAAIRARPRLWMWMHRRWRLD